MKTLLTTILIFCSMITWAQMPQGFKYQGLARDHDLQPIHNQEIRFRASILSQDPNGEIEFQEVHTIITSPTGLFNVTIGGGDGIQGDFHEINWSDGPFYLQVDLDMTGNGAFEYIGTSPLLAVPFAMHAVTAEYVDDADANPTNELQNLIYDAENHRLKISDGNEIQLPAGQNGDDDIDPVNELQQLHKTGNRITLSQGGSVIDETEDSDADPSNEIQQLTKKGNLISLSNGGSVIDEVKDSDADPSNEIQTLSYDTQKSKLKISGGNEIDLSMGDGDGDPDNELQQLQVYQTNNQLEPINLRITEGNTVAIPLITPWGVHKKDEKITGLSANVPVRLNDLYLKNIEVFSTPSHWPYPQITQKEYGFKTGNGRIGMRLAKDRLAYFRKDEADKILMYLGHNGLRYYDYRHFVTSEVGGTNNGGYLRLYPGGSTAPFFKVEKSAAGRSDLQLIGVKSKGFLFRAGEATSGWGYGYWSGSNGSHNVTLGAYSNSGQGPNSGSIMVHDKGSAAKAGAYVNAAGKGVLFADIKNFRVDHPANSKKEIVYASIEGPEAAIYDRGTAQLVNGEAEIIFSQHFQLMLHQENLTVMLTPLSSNSQGIAVIEKTVTGFKVKEFHKGEGSYRFDWEAKGIRKGYESFQVVQDKIILPK